MASLKAKLAVLFVSTFVLLAACTLVFLQSKLQQSMQDIGQQTAVEQIGQVGRQLDAELSALRDATHDWSNWDDTYAYLQQPADSFTERHVTNSALKSIGIKFIALLDKQGNPVFSKAVNLVKIQTESTASFDSTLTNLKTRLRHTDPESENACGLDMTTVGPVLLCWAPVRKSDLSGSPPGTLVFARLLNSTLINKIQNHGDLKFDLTPYSSNDPALNQKISATTVPDAIHFESDHPDSAEALLHNILGVPILKMHVNIPHGHQEHAAAMINRLELQLGAIIALTGMVVFVALNTLIVNRLTRIGSELSSIWRNSRWAERIYSFRRADELSEIGHTINRMLGLIRKQSNALLEIAHTDSLTQLANRRCFELRIPVEISLHKRNQTALSLLVFDIDHFKLYNDLHGYPAGDEILVELAKLLNQIACRPSDLTARLGKDRFAVILAATDLDGAAHVAETLAKKLADRKIPHGNSPIAETLTVSIGVTTAGDEDADSLLQRVEQAHEQARKSGKNQICVMPAA